MENGHYTRAQRQLHWWVAILVAGEYLGQKAMRRAMQRVDETTAPALGDFLITTAHTMAGLTVFALIVWRVKLRREHPVRIGAGSVSPRWARLARAWHWSLYAAITSMVATGATAYYTDIELAARVHGIGKWVLGTLVIGHMLASLVHWFIFKDQVLHQMLGNRGDADTIRGSDQSPD